MKRNRKIGINRLVMIHPNLTTDPINMQGEFGRVLMYDVKGNVVITFGQGYSGKYDPIGLITLYPKTVIESGLLNNIGTNSYQDQQLIKAVLKKVNQNRHMDAIKLAWGNETARFFCTTTFDQWTVMQQEKHINEIRHGRGL